MLSLFCSWRKLIVREVKWCFQGQWRAGSGVLAGLLLFAESGHQAPSPRAEAFNHLGAELGLILNAPLPKCVGFAYIFCKISPRRSRMHFPEQVVSPLSSALALSSAPALHNSFHKYLLHNMTRCQKRPRAARKSLGKTIITHLRFFFCVVFFLQ